MITWFKRLPGALLRDLVKGRINLYAMSLAYIMLLSLVPLLALSFSVLKGFGVHNQLEPVLLNLLQPLGERAAEITRQLLTFVGNMKVGVLGAVGLGVLFYTVFSLMHKLVGAINYTWNTDHAGSLRQRVTDYFALLLIGPVLLFSVAGAATDALRQPYLQSLLEIGFVNQMVQWLLAWLPFALVILSMSLVYWFLPSVRVRPWAALIGGVVAGFLWKTLGLAFATFVVGSAKYTAIYSAFASLLLFLIWMYLSALALLLGSRIAFYVQFPAALRLDRKAAPAPPDKRLGLNVLWRLMEAFRAGRGPVKDEALAVDPMGSSQRAEATIQALENAGLIVQVNSRVRSWVLARAPDTVSMTEVLEALDDVALTDDAKDPAAGVLQKARVAIAREFDGVTLRQWFDESD